MNGLQTHLCPGRQAGALRRVLARLLRAAARCLARLANRIEGRATIRTRLGKWDQNYCPLCRAYKIPVVPSEPVSAAEKVFLSGANAMGMGSMKQEDQR